MKILSTPVLVLLLSSTSRAFASTLRGGSDVDSPFTCSLSAFDEDSCTSSKDDSGTACVWCSLSGAGGAGICVSKDQYDAMGGICSADDDDAPSPDDDAVVTDDDAPAPDDDNAPDDDAPAPDDDKAPDDDTPAPPDDDFWDCLKSMDKTHCSCTWCIAKPGFGICLNDEAAKDAEGSDWFNCSGAVEGDHDKAMNPLDPQCLAAGMGSDDAQSVCDATLDSNGTPCVWCDVAGGYGLCLSSDAADTAGQFLTCDKSVIDTKETSNTITTPFDPKCLLAGNQIDCDSAEDSSGTQCVWCDAAGVFGLCLSSATAESVKQYLQCDQKEEERPEISDDFFDCFTHNDRDECNNEECTWCSTPVGFGMCFSDDAVDVAKMYAPFLDCDSPASAVEDPLDTSCIGASFAGDDAEDTCHDTQDMDGNPCVWCAGPSPSVGLCLCADQADMASQWLTCDGASSNLETDI